MSKTTDIDDQLQEQRSPEPPSASTSSTSGTDDLLGTEAHPTIDPDFAAPKGGHSSHSGDELEPADGMEDGAEDQLDTEAHPLSAIEERQRQIEADAKQASLAEQVAAPRAPMPQAPMPATAAPRQPLDDAMGVLERLRARMQAQVIGRDEVIDLVLVALLADGHVLLEDFPGSGKTTLAKSLGQSIYDERAESEGGAEGEHSIVPFRRVQFTPDLLPADVTGVTVFDAASSTFHFRHGPIFAHVVLADEINRTSPKVQSAMLEAMAEKQVTVDNVTHPLDDLFFVIATQNPLDLAGTYPLPVAQLDRFLFKIRMDHIDRASELEVLDSYRQRRDVERKDLPRVTRSEVIAARQAVDTSVVIDSRIKECLVDVAQAVRDDERVVQGCSTRSLVLMLPALQAMAALRGRDYVSADDIQTLVPRVLGHRLELTPGVNDIDAVLNDALETAVEGLARSTLRRS